jgi:hypothetical protein
MIRKPATNGLAVLLGGVAFASAIAQLPGDDSKPAVHSNNSEDATTVSAFGGGQQFLAETIQFLVAGPNATTIATLGGDDTVKLPGRLNLATKSTTARFRLTRSGTDSNITCVGSLTFCPSPSTSDFLTKNALAVNITTADLRDASNGVVTQFIFLPHRRSTEKWAGHLGTLTMGGVTSTQRAEVLENLKRRGHLLAELQIVAETLAENTELPTFPADKEVRRTMP